MKVLLLRKAGGRRFRVSWNCRKYRVSILRSIRFVNDEAKLNTRYRSSLMAALEAEGWALESDGLFENGRPRLKTMLGIALGFGPALLSSNMRTNLFALACFWRRGLVILNGLGRHRQSSLLRRLVLLLLAVSHRKRVAVQNYADYRYFCRYGRGPALRWVPGSGGTKKECGPPGVYLVVQRDDKLASVAADLRRLLGSLQLTHPLIVVGCTDSAAVAATLPGIPVDVVGYLPSSDIFRHGGIFLQPGGYGEGFPHALADAITSRMAILISDMEYLRYGLHRLGCRLTPVCDGWSQLEVPEEARRSVTAETVNRSYVELLTQAVRKGRA
ncbi:MAG: hypothetical protein KF895_00900 [Parvibaculum sp.]|nr:hypothetical protein [Parvibaculum sp.]